MSYDHNCFLPPSQKTVMHSYDYHSFIHIQEDIMGKLVLYLCQAMSRLLLAAPLPDPATTQ